MLISIREYRQQLRLTQQALADRLGITREHLSAIENGHKTPSLTLLRKIANELKVPLACLIRESA